ncbi:MAG: HXXEE domain-containing protein [Promethearchaeota archaeon]
MSLKNFYYEHWPKVGIVVAVFLLLILFLNSLVPIWSNSLESIGSFVWLYWFSLPLYMIHQFEEYVYPGGFREDLNKILLKGDTSQMVLTEKIAFFVNIVFIWILTPVLIVLGSISIIFPVGLMTLVAFNGFVHLGGTIRFKRYNPGVIVSVVGNIPLGLYVLIALGVTGEANVLELFVGIAGGIIGHLVLLVFLALRARKISSK